MSFATSTHARARRGVSYRTFDPGSAPVNTGRKQNRLRFSHHATAAYFGKPEHAFAGDLGR